MKFFLACIAATTYAMDPTTTELLLAQSQADMLNLQRLDEMKVTLDKHENYLNIILDRMKDREDCVDNTVVNWYNDVNDEITKMINRVNAAEDVYDKAYAQFLVDYKKAKIAATV